MITIKNLSKSYHHQKVLDRVELTIPQESIFALLGPNGSGKTTLLKSLLGIVRPAPNTEIILNQHSVFGSKAFKEQVGYMPQFPKFLPHLTVKEIISLFEKLRKKKGLHKDVLIRDLEMDSFWTKPFGELSGGMAQKVNILCCFMFDPLLFILDEPTLGLDPQITFYLKRLILKKKESGKTVLFTSHIMSEVEELADQMALLVEGKIYAVISPNELKKQKNAASLEVALNQFWNTIKK